MDTVLFCGRRMTQEQLISCKNTWEEHLHSTEEQLKNGCNASQELVLQELMKELQEKIGLAEEKLSYFYNMDLLQGEHYEY